jgi:hypothetical protein
MEKDWKADLLLVQKLMGLQRIGKKEQKTWHSRKTYLLIFLSKNQNTKQRTRERKKRKKKKWLEHCALRNPGRTLSASINKTKTSKKNKAEIVIQLKTKEKKRNDDNRC